jgi:glutamyl-tRNA reductase
LGGGAHGLEELPKILPLGDIVISCLRSDSFVLSVQGVEAALRARRQAPMFLIDLGVPRNIHPEVNSIDNVYLYNVDHLESIVQQNVLERAREVERCTPILEEETQEFFQEVGSTDMTALLTEVRERLQGISDEELRKTLSRLNGLSDAHRGEVEDLARRIVNKILHPPSQTLRQSTQERPSHSIIELVRKLFGINK